LSALYGLAAVWVVFLVFVVSKFVQAFAHLDQHRDWEWLDYRGMHPMRLELRSLKPLKPVPLGRDQKPLLCRVVAPDRSLFRPHEMAGGSGVVHPSVAGSALALACEVDGEPRAEVDEYHGCRDDRGEAGDAASGQREQGYREQEHAPVDGESPASRSRSAVAHGGILAAAARKGKGCRRIRGRFLPC